MKEFISLAQANPELAKEWHPTKNGELTPSSIGFGSDKKVWWLLKYYDKNTNQTFNFEWEASVWNRNNGAKCPFLSGQAIYVGFNDLQTLNPQLASEWHPTKNGNLTPQDVTVKSTKKVWWLLPYDDSETGKHFDFEWEATIGSRTAGNGCPYLVGNQVWVGYNDLATNYPNLAREWHSTKNGDLRPTQVTARNARKVWWEIYHTTDDNKTFHFEWQATIYDRVTGDNCPYLSNAKLYKGFNDLLTVNPNLAKEWDFEKNDKAPSDYFATSHTKVWWKCEFGHSWYASIEGRHLQNRGCPYCAKSLQTSYPEIVTYYYVKKLFPDAISGDRESIDMELDVYIPSIKTAIEYDGFKWHKDKLESDNRKNILCHDKGINLIRIREHGCPQLLELKSCTIINASPKNQNDLVKALEVVANILHVKFDIDLKRDNAEIMQTIYFSKTKNSLSDTHPEVASQWHPTKNGNLMPNCVKYGSQRRVWLKVLHHDDFTGKDFVFEWNEPIQNRIRTPHSNPYLSGKKIMKGFNDLATRRPDIASQWDYEKNDKDITPFNVTVGSCKRVWWKCEHGHSWDAIICNRTYGYGCPHCYALSRKSKSK